jgi:hypothetical protein
VRTAEFWEVSDRGVNFDYLSPDRKAKMLDFFDWFGEMIPARPSVLPTRTSEMPIIPADAVAPEQIGEGARMQGVPGTPDKRLTGAPNAAEPDGADAGGVDADDKPKKASAPPGPAAE